MELKSFANKKVLMYGAGFAVFLVIVLFLRNATGGSAATTVTTTTAQGPSAAQIQASTSIALANIEAASAANQLNGQLTLQTQAQQADLTKTQMQMQLAKQSLESDAALQQLQMTTAAQIAQKQLDAQISQTINGQQLQASIAKWTIDSNVAMQANQNAFQLEYAEAANSSQERITAILANVTNNQLIASRDVNLATIAAGVSNTQTMANATVEQSKVNAARDVAMQNAMAKQKKSGGLFGFLGDALKVVAPLVL